MARLEIRLLGAVEVALDGQPLHGFDAERVCALLAYLAVESDRPHRREKLAGLLWPDSPDEAARTNLRRTLSHLRRAIHDQDAVPPVVDASAQTVRLDCAGDVWVDVLALQQHIADSRVVQFSPPLSSQPGDRSQTTDPSPSSILSGHLLSAVGLYRGPFLEGFSLAGSPAFEEWALLEQERLHRLVLEALHSLTEQLEQQGEVEQALRHAWKQVELEPWRESGHRQVMRLLARSGQRSAALAQYEACCRRLVKDLGAEPSVETTDLYRRIRDQADDLGEAISPYNAALPVATEGGTPAAGPAEVVPADGRPHKLPLSLGRRAVPDEGKRRRFAAGAVTLLAVLAVVTLLAIRPWERPRAGAEPPGATSPAADGSPAESQPSTAQPLALQVAGAGEAAITATVPRRIVFASAEISGTQVLGHIYAMDRDGRQRQQLPGSDEAQEESRPVWLPDRQGIVYEQIERTESTKRFSLWRMNPDGSGRQPLLGGADARSAAVSPDGTRLAFNSRRAGSHQVFIVGLDGGEPVQLTNDPEGSRRPSWSPDGLQLAFDAGDVGSSSIYVVGVDGSGLRRLTAATQDIDPAWSPDGRFIAFASLRDGNLEIYVMDADGSNQTNVSSAPQSEDRDVSWTPDGHLIFASDRDGDFEIYVMNRNGSHVVKLTDNTVDDRWPNWK